MSLVVPDPKALMGMTVVGPGEETVGAIHTVYLDHETGAPAWVAVATGSGDQEVFLVPLADAELLDSGLRTPHSGDQVGSAPHHDPAEELSLDDEDELYAYYAITPPAERVLHDEDRPEPDFTAGSTETQDPAPTTGPTDQGEVDGADMPNTMTRSEEHLNVSTEQVTIGRARLRKFVVTEMQTVTVPVSHEEVRIVREPITDNGGGSGEVGVEINDDQTEIILHAEQPVVTTEAVAVERVRLAAETVTEEQEISQPVRKEQIEADTIDADPARTSD